MSRFASLISTLKLGAVVPNSSFVLGELITIVGTFLSTLTGYITVRFYANDTLGHLNFDEVIIVKDVPIPTSQPGIPGYNVFVLIGIISLMAVITIKFKYSKKIE